MVDFMGLGLEIGGGGVLGAITGWAAKKVAKIIAFIIGVEVALFKFLETKGVLTVDWGALQGAAGNATNATANQAGAASGWFHSILSVLPVGAGFTAGALLGWKKG